MTRPPTLCAFCGRSPATEIRRDYHVPPGGGVKCEANEVCAECGAEARRIDADLEARGLLR